MRTKHLRNLLCASLLGLCACAATSGEKQKTDSHTADSTFLFAYDFVDHAADTIHDPSGSLAPFFEALLSIKTEGATVPIIHFGDSHIQGGFLTMTVMRRFARDYGTAGRGFITPHKLAGKNEPRDYSITATPPLSSSNSTTIIDQESRTTTIGISGVAAPCPTRGELTIRFLAQADEESDFRFRRIVAFHDSLAPMISIADPLKIDDAGGSDIFNSFSTELNLLQPTDSITLRTAPDGAFTGGAIYGFSLENGNAGVLYHSIGVNGACYLHWGRQKEIARQSAALTPRLIIISLGANEASGTNFIESVFIEQMDSFITSLRQANPGVPILLTTPADYMRGRGKSQRSNENVGAVGLAMKKYVDQHGLALFDLYAATSGAGSAEKWREANLLSRDGIHYTSEGYTLQGLLLYSAFENEAKKYNPSK